jgi:hypothetical protein
MNYTIVRLEEIDAKSTSVHWTSESDLKLGGVLMSPFIKIYFIKAFYGILVGLKTDFEK